MRTKILILLLGLLPATLPAAARPNILFITVDDMNCDSVGAFGCPLPETTPHIDRLARSGLRFERAHVVVGNCMPSRNCMLSGRYPHNNRVEGFYPVKDKDYPVLCDLMRQGGYFTAIRGKVSHSTPFFPYEWDLVLDDGKGRREHPKDVESYHRSTATGIAAASRAGRPFCLLINISDPHKPFYGTGKRGEPLEDPHRPSRVFTPGEVPVPGFLFDDPEVRRELAQYYSTVRRADDCVGQILRALSESGSEPDTIVVFLSDHGMPLPFAKTAVYHHSTRTPLIVRWPGITRPGTADATHMVSAVDILPTFLDFAGLQPPSGMDGRSFASLVHGAEQEGRDFVIKEYNENSGGARHPMRSVQTHDYCYIFNPWADGQRTFKTATQGTVTYRRMQALAKTDRSIAARLELFDHRVLEELYDLRSDPDCLHNLAGDPGSATELQRHRDLLESWMRQTDDHALAPFRNRRNPGALNAYMSEVERASEQRRQGGKRRRTATDRQLIRLDAPDSCQPGQTVSVRVHHSIPPRLGTQKLHVTLKVGAASKRHERKTVSIEGTGAVTLVFPVPESVPDQTVAFAAFVGEDYSGSLQHVTTRAIPTR